ncbi:chromosome partitioning protein ParA [Eggerthellaceae bacterium 3-80]|nr:chromosome partitioning protein ParA [bacterium D16-34]
MNTPAVVLCIDQVSQRYPEQLGLSGENFSTQPWLKVFNEGLSVRNYLGVQDGVEEVWVISSDDVAPINLAAAIKKDKPACCVCLLTHQESGSLMSRVKTTGIDASLTLSGFARRYASRKQRHHDRELAAHSLTSEQPPLQTPPVQSQTAVQTDSEPLAKSAERVASVSDAVAAAKKTSGFVMSVVSGSGGTGKSAISLLLAYLACGLGKKTVLVDADLQFGDLAELSGRPDAIRITDVATNAGLLTGVITDEQKPALLGAPRHIEEAEAAANVLCSVIDQLASSFEVVILNTGSSWAEYHAMLLERSSKALFLVDQRPTAIMSNKRALDLCARCGIAASPFLVGVNRYAKGAPFTSIDVSFALHGIPAVEISEGGQEVGELLAAGLVGELLASQNALCQSLEQLLVEVLPGIDKDQWQRQRSGRARRRKLSRRKRRKLMNGGA